MLWSFTRAIIIINEFLLKPHNYLPLEYFLLSGK